jgi:Amt family ammonium transporter
VHGVNGLFGVLCVGLFSTGEYGAGWNGVTGDGVANFLIGIMPFGSTAVNPDGSTIWFTSAGFAQLGAQAIGAVTCIVFGFGMAWVWFKLSNLIIPMRVPREFEIQGCDIPEVGALAYPDFELKTTQSVSEGGMATAKI